MWMAVLVRAVITVAHYPGLPSIVIFYIRTQQRADLHGATSVRSGGKRASGCSMSPHRYLLHLSGDASACRQRMHHHTR